MRDHEVLPHPEARHVAHDQRDGIAALARSHSGALSIGASSEAHSAARISAKRGDGVAVQLADHIFSSSGSSTVPLP